ncbi:fatty acid oxidation complex subunit alpha [Striga asiatica]|uniref:Fatty acid oxidation complex subunit alpha n=1 Tax=Striga asiatica TaxID=4170 RepID=A0A5A7QB25_STRAF|nr:fatty acid oxidation complex subunit alpha [Striga asiatica]
MGNCGSSKYVNRPNFTAKLILLNGKLLEFEHPVKASLLTWQNPSFFICSSEGMEFGQLAAEVGGDEVLRLGEVYFELPVEWRSHKMQAEDIAELAAKASLALSGGGEYDDEAMIRCGCCSPRSRVEPLVPVFKEETVPPPDEGGGKRRGGRCKRRRKFEVELSSITEE